MSLQEGSVQKLVEQFQMQNADEGGCTNDISGNPEARDGEEFHDALDEPKQEHRKDNEDRQKVGQKETSYSSSTDPPQVDRQTDELEIKPGLKFQEHMDSMIIEWAAASSVEYYKLLCKSKGQTVERNISQAKIELKKSNFGWEPGGVITIDLTAVDKSGNIISICKDAQYIIGGETVPTDVKLSYNGDISHSSLILNWNGAKLRPHLYEVTVYEGNSRVNGTFTTAATSKTLTDLNQLYSKTLTDLTHLTKYYCVIVAKYHKRNSGKPVVSNTLETRNLPTCKVLAYKDPTNKARQIIVELEKPMKEVKNSRYEVCLYENQSKVKIQKVDGGSYKFCFKNLKSRTTYRACVVTVVSNQTYSTGYSDPVTTDVADHDPEFDIKEKGKPVLKPHTVVPNGEKLQGTFEWDLPNIGKEKNNYQIVGVKAYLKEANKRFVELSVENGNQAKAYLSYGRQYIFMAECEYFEYDYETSYKATTFRDISTDIGEPSIASVQWFNDEIVVNWCKGKGATGHKMRVLDEAEKEVYACSPAEHATISFAMTTNCCYGKECLFIVEASGHLKKKEAKKRVLIGGETAVTKVVAICDTANPRRAMIVSWKPPKRIPRGYTVSLFELRDKSSDAEQVEVTDTLERTCKMFKFKELKTQTVYFARVCPVYENALNEGSLSNKVKTDKRLKTAQESKNDFGKVEKIVHSVKNDSPGKLCVDLSWSSVQMGENFRVTGYRVHVDQKWRLNISSTNVFEDTTEPNVTMQRNIVLKMGHKFDAKVFTQYIDLDTSEKKETGKVYTFSTGPSSTIINDAKWHDGVIEFSWLPVSGAKKYQLVVKDNLLEENLIPDQWNQVQGEDEGCLSKVAMTEKIGVGKNCMTKVIVHAEGGTSESDWKAHLIGGDSVVKNVKAILSSADPRRTIKISFDQPLKGPAEEYKIVAVPTPGKEKAMYTSINAATFEYLRTGTLYRFKVYAKWNGIWSEETLSNAISTKSKEGQTPLINIRDSEGANVHMQRAHLSRNTTNLKMRGENFGQVKDVRPLLSPHGNEDVFQLVWTIPSFDSDAYDYKVEEYKVNIMEKNSLESEEIRLPFEKNCYEYRTDKRKLQLGKTYEVTIATTYEDIDEDEKRVSAAVKLDVHTRPCQPMITCNKVIDDTLKVEWNAATGAYRYGIEVFTDNANRAQFKKDISSSTIWEKKFDEDFGYGTTYFIKVTAFGSEDKTNFCKTDYTTIGGEYVPTDVEATIKDVADPNTQSRLSWKCPKFPAVSYEIESVPKMENLIPEYDNATSCIVSGLKAGTEYYFKVSSVYVQDGIRQVTGGCSSNKIKTNPTPTQVKHVWCNCEDITSASVKVHWEKVQAERESETTKYRVILANLDETSRNELNVVTEHALFEGLAPGSEYFVTVAGGNSLGYGRESDKIKVKTEFGTPRNVQLGHCKDHFSSSLALNFLPAVGKVVKYTGTLYRHDTSGKQKVTSTTLTSGYAFQDLMPDSKYTVKVTAQFDKGCSKHEISNEMMTAPSKPEIIEHRPHSERGEISSRELFMKWKSDTNANKHELKITPCPHGSAEATILVENECFFRYTCQREAWKYSVQVRSKNESERFGYWSDEKIVELAPAKLEGVIAELENDGLIVVQCHKPQRPASHYLMTIFSNDEPIGEPQRAEIETEKNLIVWKYNPTEAAQSYRFSLWAEDSTGCLRSEKIFSNYVISKPSPVVMKKVVNNPESSSTELEISWEEQARCNAYEVYICVNNQDEPECVASSSKTSYTYKCHNPGIVYLVCVRAIRDSIKGAWSEKFLVNLAPAQVELIEELNTSNLPVKRVSIKWEPLKAKPSEYLVQVFCNGKQVDEAKTECTEYLCSTNLAPGSLCYCTVVAYNGDLCGKPTKSRYYRIAWSKASFLSIFHDCNEPSRKARMEWDSPAGVNCFKLKIENNETGVVKTVKLCSEKYIFESGIPGNSYTVRLYCGCDEQYDVEYKENSMTMKPAPPRVVKVHANSKINGLVINFTDDFTELKKSYEICLEPMTRLASETRRENTSNHCLAVRNLLPGETYKVSVTTIIGNKRSFPTTCNEYVPTFPGNVINLRSKRGNGNVIFEWDNTEIKPDEYAVQWRVGNDPITEERIQNASFSIHFIKPAHCYSARVMACNASGCGPCSDWNTFVTDPSPPYKIEVQTPEKSPETSLLVKFEDQWDALKAYRIAACSPDGKEKTITTNEHHVILTDLKPGQAYIVSVQTLFCGKESIPAVYS